MVQLKSDGVAQSTLAVSTNLFVQMMILTKSFFVLRSDNKITKGTMGALTLPPPPFSLSNLDAYLFLCPPFVDHHDHENDDGVVVVFCAHLGQLL